MNKTQQTVLKVVSHCIKQGRTSTIDERGLTCAYRGLGGLSCAIGCLIPDEIYDPEIDKNNEEVEDTSFLHIHLISPRVASFLRSEYPELYDEDEDGVLLGTRLQNFHDRKGFVSEYRTNALLAEHGLTIDDLEGIA